MRKKYDKHIRREEGTCEWCGNSFYPFRAGKRYCCNGCRAFAWREQPPAKKERANAVGYIKRRRDVKFKEYLPLLRRYNKIAMEWSRTGEKVRNLAHLRRLEAVRDYLKSHNARKHVARIKELLEKLEGTKNKGGSVATNRSF